MVNYNKFSEKIIQLKNADLQLRSKLIQNGGLGSGYNEEMRRLHNRNAEILDRMIDIIGYPTIDKVGKDANEAAWLIIQHSIEKPAFMKRCVVLLEKAIEENRADPLHLAYLSDRIAVFEGQRQLYGTQFDWDENGELSPNPYDDIIRVNKRRKLIGLNKLEKQTKKLRMQAENENESPPNNLDKRKQEFDEWKKKVGWT